MTRSRRGCILIALLLPLGADACGKKGPPLAPLRPVPARVSDVTARRLGQEVYVRFTIPSANQDLTAPADLERLEVYGLTVTGLTPGAPLGDDLLEEFATLVTTIEVRPPPDPVDASEAAPPEDVLASSQPVDERPSQGQSLTVVEVLTPELKVPVDVFRSDDDPAPAPPPSTAAAARPLVSPVLAPAPMPRTYVIVGVSQRGLRGAPSEPVRVSLVDPPPPPPAPDLYYNHRAVVAVEWTRPQGARRVQEAAVAPVLPSRVVGSWPEPLRYNLYEVTVDRGVPAVSSTPLNANPVEAAPFLIRREPVPVVAPVSGVIAAPLIDPSGAPASGALAQTVSDPEIAFGAERCYVLRAVATEYGRAVESESSQPGCITLRDIYPPAPPRGLTAVGSETGISLIWDPNQDPDLAGYLVLRGEAPGETLQPLTPEPIRATTYHDADVREGVRYVYAVVAVDNATPPNTSDESDRAEEAAR